MGAKVGLIARCETNLQTISDEIREKDGIVEYAVADVMDYDGLKVALEDLTAKFEKIDGLVNNAGISEDPHLFGDLTKNDIDKVIDTNIKGAMYGSMIMLPHFLHNCKGSIVNTGSLSSLVELPYATIYATTKWAINGFTKSLAADYEERRITVNAILPGWIESEITDKNRALLERMGVSFMKAERMVQIYAFFFTKQGRRTTGTLIHGNKTLDIWDYAKTIPDSQTLTWDILEPTIKEQCKESEYRLMKRCKALMNYLFSLP